MSKVNGLSEFKKSKYHECKESVLEAVKLDLEKYIVLLNPIKVEKTIRINVSFSCEIFTSAFSDSVLDGSNGKIKITQPKKHDISPFLSYDTCFGNLGIHSEEDAIKISPEIKRILINKKNLEKRIISKAYNKCKKFGYNKEESLDVLFDILNEIRNND